MQKLVADKLKERDVEVILKKTVKSGDIIQDGLMMQNKDSGQIPVVYLDELYEFYINNDLSVEEAADKVVEVYNSTSGPEVLDLDKYRNWENARDSITIRVMNTKLNRKYLEDAVYEIYLDLAIVYYITYITDDGEIYRCKVLEKLLDGWGIDAEVLKETAVENTKRMLGIRVQEIHEALINAAGIRDSETIDKITEYEGIPMFVLTNNYSVYGAANMFIDEVLKSIAEIFDTDIYIIPSSVHEVLIIPKNDMYTKDEINDMIKNVNLNVLAPEDILSDHVYVYSKECEMIII